MVNAPKRKTNRTKRKKMVPIKSIKKVAVGVYNRNIEKKELVAGFAQTIAGNNSTSTTISPDVLIRRLDPNNNNLPIAQGVKQNERVGNKVKLVSGKLTLAIWPRPSQAGNTNNLQMIRVMILYDKRNPTTTPTPFGNLDFFQQSSATGFTGFSGQMYDLINRVNEDRYNILYDKTFKLGQAILT